METRVYKTLAKILGIVLVLVGIAAIIGGRFADSFIAEQLSDQHITMPTEEAIDAQVESGRISEDDAEALRPFAGEEMTNGNQAKAFANNYIYAHMKAGATAAGYPDANYSNLGGYYGEKEAALIEELRGDNPDADDEQLARMAAAEIQDPLTEYEVAREAAALEDMRYGTFLDGNTLRGMLLNAYGWGLVGTIATWAGIGLLLGGIALAVYGFIPSKKARRDDVDRVEVRDEHAARTV